MSQRKM